jgi:hypothetical protein
MGQIVSGVTSSEKCLKARRAIQEVLERYEVSQVSFKICDLSGRPNAREDDDRRR